MKKLLLCILHFCCVLPAIAQHAAVMAHKMNIFYIGVHNPVTVMAEGYNCKETLLQIEGATITPGTGPCDFHVLVEKPGMVKVRVLAKEGKGTKVVGEVPFRVKYIPDPVAKLANKSVGQIAVAEAKAQLGVIAVLYNFDFDARFTIASYTMEVYRDDKIVFSNKNAGAKFDERTMTFLPQLQAGDKLLISQIISIGPDKEKRELTNIYLTLK